MASRETGRPRGFIEKPERKGKKSSVPRPPKKAPRYGREKKKKCNFPYKGKKVSEYIYRGKKGGKGKLSGEEVREKGNIPGTRGRGPLVWVSGGAQPSF